MCGGVSSAQNSPEAERRQILLPRRLSVGRLRSKLVLFLSEWNYVSIECLLCARQCAMNCLAYYSSLLCKVGSISLVLQGQPRLTDLV